MVRELNDKLVGPVSDLGFRIEQSPGRYKT